MRTYYYDEKPGDGRLPHDSGEELSSTDLRSLGVLYYKFPPSSADSAAQVDDLAKSRHCVNRDENNISPAAMGAAFEGKAKMFYNEHLHEDEELRYVLEGSGYIDVRNEQGKWIRIKTEPGDLSILPAGLYHRVTVDENNYIKVMRLFKDEPKWDVLYRGEEADANEARKAYLSARASLVQG
ncbi:MAG: hypothetical protein Q9166_007354 [cf. Caloplaca sp. 2 TL-2023]